MPLSSDAPPEPKEGPICHDCPHPNHPWKTCGAEWPGHTVTFCGCGSEKWKNVEQDPEWAEKYAVELHAMYRQGQLAERERFEAEVERLRKALYDSAQKCENHPSSVAQWFRGGGEYDTFLCDICRREEVAESEHFKEKPYKYLEYPPFAALSSQKGTE